VLDESSRWVALESSSLVVREARDAFMRLETVGRLVINRGCKARIENSLGQVETAMS
jgi:hypothetical protein